MTEFKAVGVPAFLVGMAILVAQLFGGCGAASQHETLNTITDVADPTYAIAVQGCESAFDVVLQREGTTYEEDSAAFDQIEAVCDPMVEGFEALRDLQISARSAIDSGTVEGVAVAAIHGALRLWARLKAMVPTINELGRAQ